MKVSATEKTSKAKQLQELRASHALGQKLMNGSAEADLLLKEFSEVMDKIAAKLKESTSSKKINAFNDFGLGAAELVRTEQISKEKPAPIPSETQRSPESRKEEKDSGHEGKTATPSREKQEPSNEAQPPQTPAAQKELKQPATQNAGAEKRDLPADKKAAEEVPAALVKSIDVSGSKTKADTAAQALESSEAPIAAVKADPIADLKGPSKIVPEKTQQNAQQVQPEGKHMTEDQPKVEGSKSAEQVKLPELLAVDGQQEAEMPQTNVSLETAIRAAVAKVADSMIGRGHIESVRRGIEKDVIGAAQANKQASENGLARGIEDHKAINPAGNSSNGVGVFARNNESTARAEAPRSPRAMTQAASLRTMEKVENALKEAAKSRDGKTISLRLDPPELGSVKIDVSLRDGSLHARIVAETPAVNQFLRERSHELQSMLRKLGLDVDSVSVSVGSEQRSFDEQHAFRSSRQGQGLSMQGFVQSEAPPAVSGGVRVVDDHWVA